MNSLFPENYRALPYKKLHNILRELLEESFNLREDYQVSENNNRTSKATGNPYLVLPD